MLQLSAHRHQAYETVPVYVPHNDGRNFLITSYGVILIQYFCSCSSHFYEPKPAGASILIGDSPIEIPAIENICSKHR